MGAFNAGAIEANLTLGRSSWTADLKKTIKEIDDLERRSVTVGIDADDTNARIAMDNIELFLDDLDQKTYTPSIDANAKDFHLTLDKIDERLDELDARRVTAQIFANTDNAKVSIDNLERDLDFLDRDPVTVAIDIMTSEAHAILDALEVRLDRLDHDRVVIEVDADTDNAQVRFSLLEDEIFLLERQNVTIDVDADTLAAEEKLIAVGTFAQALDMSHIDIPVDIDGYATAIAKMATLEAQAAVLDHNTINLDVDVDKDTLAGLVGEGGSDAGRGSLGLLRILIYAIILLSPILGAAIGALTAAIVGFAAALTGAAGAALILGAGLFGLVKQFNALDPSEYTPAMQGFADSITAVKDAWGVFIDGIGDAGFTLMTQALELVAGILPTLIPLFNIVAGAISGVLDSVQGFVNSSEYNDMLDFFGGFGVDMLVSFLNIGGNLLKFFGRLFQAIAPFATEMMTGLEHITAGWADWADDLENNAAFQHFVEKSLEYGPMVLDMLGSLLQAFINISHALEPFAGPMLTALTMFFDAIAEFDPAIMGAIVAGLAGWFAGAKIIVPVIELLAGGLETLSIALGIGIAPILAIVALIAVLAGTFIYLWKTNEDFRDGIIDTWNNIQETVGPIIQDIVDAFMENWGAISDWLDGILGDWLSIVQDAFTSIEQVIKGVLAVIGFVWDNFGEDIINVVKGTFQIIGSVVGGAFDMLAGFFHLIKSVLTGDWKGAWDAIKQILSGAWSMITGVLKGALTVWGAIFNAIRKVLSAAWSATWDFIKGAASSGFEWVKTKWNDLIGWFRGLGGKISGAVSGIWDGITRSFKNMINGIIGLWNNLSFTIDIPDKIPGLPSSFTVSTPNVPTLAQGAYLTQPTLNVAGEAGPEIVAPEPVLRRIVRENSGAAIDYGKIASAVAAALASVLPRSITAEDLDRLIAAASINLNIDATNGDGQSAAQRLASVIGFELRLLGYGGVE